MAVMSAGDRNACHIAFEDEVFNAERQTTSLSRADIRAAVDALDTYFSDNAATINQALPVAARTTLTTAQKARLLIYVIRQRYLAGV